DPLRGDRLGGHDQVALVLAVGVVDDHHHLPGGDGRDRLRDAREPAHPVLPALKGPRSRSTYLASTSTSIWTSSPGARAPSVVTASVCGTSATENQSGPAAATVRLTPSTATEP